MTILISITKIWTVSRAPQKNQINFNKTLNPIKYIIKYIINIG